MQSKHPQANLIRGHAVATPDMRNSDGRYLIITPVMPEPDKTNMLLSNLDIPPGESQGMPSGRPADILRCSDSKLLREQRNARLLVHSDFRESRANVDGDR